MYISWFLLAHSSKEYDLSVVTVPTVNKKSIIIIIIIIIIMQFFSWSRCYTSILSIIRSPPVA